MRIAEATDIKEQPSDTYIHIYVHIYIYIYIYIYIPANRIKIKPMGKTAPPIALVIEGKVDLKPISSPPIIVIIIIQPRMINQEANMERL
jgi:hypothetical protein